MGFAFDQDTISDYKNLIWLSIKLLEFILCGNQASVKSYSLKAEPVFKAKEFGAEVAKQLDDIEKGAIRFCFDFKCIEENNQRVFKKDDYLSQYCKVIKRADISTCNMFKDFAPLQSSGEGDTFPLFPSKTLPYYIFHIKNLRKEIYDSGNSLLYLKKLLHISMPYYRLCMLLRRLK